MVGVINIMHGFETICYTHGFEKKNKTVGRAQTRSSLERKVRSSNLGPVKSNTVLPTAHHCCDISSKGAVLPGRNDAEMDPANSFHAPAYYIEYNERFDLILCMALKQYVLYIKCKTTIQTKERTTRYLIDKNT